MEVIALNDKRFIMALARILNIIGIIFFIVSLIFMIPILIYLSIAFIIASIIFWRFKSKKESDSETG